MGACFRVPAKYNWLAMDSDGSVYGYIKKPIIIGDVWGGAVICSRVYKFSDTLNWEYSLAEIRKC